MSVLRLCKKQPTLEPLRKNGEFSAREDHVNSRWNAART